MGTDTLGRHTGTDTQIVTQDRHTDTITQVQSHGYRHTGTGTHREVLSLQLFSKVQRAEQEWGMKPGLPCRWQPSALGQGPTPGRTNRRGVHCPSPHGCCDAAIAQGSRQCSGGHERDPRMRAAPTGHCSLSPQFTAMPKHTENQSHSMTGHECLPRSHIQHSSGQQAKGQARLPKRGEEASLLKTARGWGGGSLAPAKAFQSITWSLPVPGVQHMAGRHKCWQPRTS